MIPDFQSIMLPFLELLSDGEVHVYRDVIDDLAVKFSLTEEEKEELLPSGTQAVFSNRVGWASTYLKKAGLIESPKRALFVISDLGRKTLSEGVDRIDTKYLKQFQSFRDFQTPKKEKHEEIENESEEEIQITPEESLGMAYKKIRSALASDLLGKVLDLSPIFFERLVVELLVKMGYGGSFEDAGKAIGRSGDEGIDGTIKEDKLGLDTIYIQAKRWAPGNIVGRPEIQKFVGALAGQGAKKGVFITTSSFSKEAMEYAPKNDTKIVLIDGESLAQYMIDFNLGCTIQHTYEIKKIDNDYFVEE